MKNVIKKISLFIVLAVLLSITLNSAMALTIDPDFKPINQPFDVTDEINERGADGPRFATILILQIIAGTLLYFAAPMAIIMFAWNAVTMARGGADPETLDKSKKSVKWAIVGLFVIILSYTLVRILLTIVLASADAAS